jgi:ATP-dependent Clp protease protease subunit
MPALPSEPSGGASGQATDIAIHAKEILRVRDSLTEIYQKHCGRPGESVDAGIDRFSELVAAGRVIRTS